MSFLRDLTFPGMNEEDSFQQFGRRGNLDDFVFDDPLMKRTCDELFAHAPEDHDVLLQQRNDLMLGEESLCDLDLTSFLFQDRGGQPYADNTQKVKVEKEQQKAREQRQQMKQEMERRVEQQVQERLRKAQEERAPTRRASRTSKREHVLFKSVKCESEKRSSATETKRASKKRKISGPKGTGRKRKSSTRTVPARQKKNIRERLRRASMSEKFRELCDLVIDNCTSKERAAELRQNQEKLSKAMVLSETIDVMRHMIVRLSDLESANKEMKQQLAMAQCDDLSGEDN